MTLRRIDAETLLTPPVPPKASIVMLGMSGYAVRISPKGGAQLVKLLPDGACSLASITAGELETFDYQLHNETGGTRLPTTISVSRTGRNARRNGRTIRCAGSSSCSRSSASSPA